MRKFELNEEINLHILRVLDQEPALSQRELAARLGISLGKVNFCLQALAQKGLLKAQNFRRSRQKLGYLYLLTPSGLAAKTDLTLRFLKLKVAEYDALQKEIEVLRGELKA